MPIYEYQCKKCHHRFERIQKFSDPHVKRCPECGGAVGLVLSAPAVQFKGSGWYVTDYAKKPPPANASADSASRTEPKTESATKKDDKPKSETKKAEKK